VRRLAVQVAGVDVPYDTVPAFQDVPDADVRVADIPSDPAPEQGARTLHHVRAAALDGDVARAPAPIVARTATIRGARLVTDTGAVVTADGRLVIESLLDHDQLLREFGERRRVRRVRRVAGRHASLISQWSENYYHWLIDCLPRLATLESVGLGDLPLVVPRRLAPFHLESLAMLGIERDRMTPFAEEADHLQPDELVWAASPAPVNFPTPWLVRWLRTMLGRGVVDERETRGRRLLISRIGVRRLANEEQVGGALGDLGFEVLVPDALSLAEQIATFAQASMIVAPHGAGLTNIAFANRAAVLELFPPSVAWHYYTLSRAAGHEYWYVIGQYATRQPRRVDVKLRDFTVDVGLVRRTVEHMMASTNLGDYRQRHDD
jgi:capsular polysaccharide biosynthesis protein